MSVDLMLHWQKCQGNVWCSLNAVNLSHHHFDGVEGVYIIWHGGSKPKVVYVGQGIIKDRISKHRIDQRIQQYSVYNLYVTWAVVAKKDRNSVELYLAKHWNPLVGEQRREASPVTVNSPWAN